MGMPLDLVAEASDEDLLARYAEGDPAAARALTLRFAPLALRVAQARLKDMAEAEDVAQEAMLRLWRIAPEWRAGEAKVSTWLYRVTANLATDRLRRRGRSVALDEVAEPEDDRPGAEAGMMSTARQQALTGALDTLPERQRQAVMLRHIEGLSNPEIAEVMDIGVEAVESLTARAKRALAGLLMPRRAELGFGDD
ncbi:RNA polymerase sigma factor [Frigidibacter sp. MR17.14]|uniref:RNA polymerase sigma factor n=1 Tax=Frigidibacter sp. MR17.14 TaxID=3126509 RepID=UPI003012CD4C